MIQIQHEHLERFSKEHYEALKDKLDNFPNNCLYSLEEVLTAKPKKLQEIAIWAENKKADYEFIKREEIQKRLNQPKTKELALKAFSRRKKRLWQIQKIIGEPFLQRVIKNYLDELELLFSDDKTLIAKELVEIEERKKYLEALQKRKG